MKKYENGIYIEMTADEIAEIAVDTPKEELSTAQLDLIEQLTDMDARLCQLEINTAEVITNDI